MTNYSSMWACEITPVDGLSDILDECRKNGSNINEVVEIISEHVRNTEPRASELVYVASFGDGVQRCWWR